MREGSWRKVRAYRKLEGEMFMYIRRPDIALIAEENDVREIISLARENDIQMSERSSHEANFAERFQLFVPIKNRSCCTFCTLKKPLQDSPHVI